MPIEQIIDFHMHVIDPLKFHDAATTYYCPLPGETGTVVQLGHMVAERISEALAQKGQA